VCLWPRAVREGHRPRRSRSNAPIAPRAATASMRDLRDPEAHHRPPDAGTGAGGVTHSAGSVSRRRTAPRGCDHARRAAVAQLVEHGTFNPLVVGSSPTGGIDRCSAMKQGRGREPRRAARGRRPPTAPAFALTSLRSDLASLGEDHAASAAGRSPDRSRHRRLREGQELIASRSPFEAIRGFTGWYIGDLAGRCDKGSRGRIARAGTPVPSPRSVTHDGAVREP
jgi:hypothetical protein